MRFLLAASLALALMSPLAAADIAPPPGGSETAAPAPTGAPPAPEVVPPPAEKLTPVPPPAAVTAFAAAHPACTEISDDCIICAVAPDAIHCSTPGIACIRAELSCRKPAPIP